MVDECRGMGGTGIATDLREAASALRWWLEMGVDAPIQEEPQNWLATASATAPVAPEPAAPVALEPAAPEAKALPGTLEAFRSWLSSDPDAPLRPSNGRAVLPVGAEAAEVMVLCEPPTREDVAAGQPLAGERGELLQRMLRAIGMADSAYIANLACFASSGTRLRADELERCAIAARRHVALVKPKRLLLMGDVPCTALLGKPLLQARGHAHKVEGIRTIATFHPRQLLKRPSDKAHAWKDLLLLTEDDS